MGGVEKGGGDIMALSIFMRMVSWECLGACSPKKSLKTRCYDMNSGGCLAANRI